MALTPKQQRFVQEYLIDLNATQAAIRAGYAKKTANREGTRLLSNAVIAAAIAEGKAARAVRVEVTADDVVRELKRIAFLDPRKVMAWGPDGVRLLPSDELPEEVAACVAEASQTVTEAGGTIKVKLASKLDALDKLARHLGMFKDKVEHSGSVVQTHVYLPQKDAPSDSKTTSPAG